MNEYPEATDFRSILVQQDNANLIELIAPRVRNWANSMKTEAAI
jgi:hypothetical protein